MLKTEKIKHALNNILSELSEDRLTLIMQYCNIKDEIADSKETAQLLFKEFEESKTKAHYVNSMFASFIIIGAIFFNLAGLVSILFSVFCIFLYNKHFDKTHRKEFECKTEKLRASRERLEEKKTRYKYDIEKIDAIIKCYKELLEDMESRESGFIANHPLSNLREDTEPKKLIYERNDI